MAEDMFQRFGYTEMYEWQTNPDNLEDRFGLFVQFSKTEPDKIEKYDGTGVFCGVTSCCFTDISDNPNEWHGKYKKNDDGAYILEKKYIAVGNKAYDQNREMNIVRTFPYQVTKKIVSDIYNSNKQYIPRLNRIEWSPICLVGKCIVQATSDVKAGGYCKPIISDNYEECGKATVWHDGDTEPKFYVLSRISENSVEILLR